MQPTADSTRKPHRGSSRCLVIAIDVGTTFSGVSYAILEPGDVPKIHGITRFPGQEHVAGNSKIPSIMYYDKAGNMKVAGAEAEGASIATRAEDEGWIKSELFKLRLRPKSMKLDMNGMQLGPLPLNKSATQVYGDFLGYLFRCTRDFIKDTHANGEALWRAVENDIQFVLSHPNGWEGAQQMRIRKSAIYGELIPNTNEGKARIRFVTEGEASLHACVLNGLAADVLSNPSNPGFIVVDAGGGTLDISSYAIKGTAPLTIEEIAPPDCIFAGSVFVSYRAREFLMEKLKNSKYGSANSVDHITKKFDETTKRLFRDRKEPQFIAFGSPFDKDLSLGIRSGQLKLTGDEVAELFEPSVETAVASIKAQIDASAGLIKSVWLVGGFAASPYLFRQLQERLAPLGITVSRPDSQTSKAVADGAIGFYCDHHVSTRMSKYMYGVEYLREFDPKDPEHIARKTKLNELPSGPKLLPDAFDCVLARRVKVKESTIFTRKYCTELTSLGTLSIFEVDIWCYRGGDTVPKWILRQSDEFSTLCVVRADLSPLTSSAQGKQGKNGKTYWTIVFSVEIQFGLTEFTARIKWVDNGETKYGPATIVYSESGQHSDDEPDSGPEDETSAEHEPPSKRAVTSGRISPNILKGATTSVPMHPDINMSSHIASPKVERTTSNKTEPPSSPHPLPRATGSESTRKEETAKEKGKWKESAAAASADKKAKAEPLVAPVPPVLANLDDDKAKTKEVTTPLIADKKSRKGAKRNQDDGGSKPNATESLASIAKQAADMEKKEKERERERQARELELQRERESELEREREQKEKERERERERHARELELQRERELELEREREQKEREREKEKELETKPKKSTKAKAFGRASVKSVGFVIPEDDELVPESSKLSPTKNKSLFEERSSFGDFNFNTTYGTDAIKNEESSTKRDKHNTQASVGLSEFDWHIQKDGDNDGLWPGDGSNDYGVGDDSLQNNYGWQNTRTTPAYLEQTSAYDHIDDGTNLKDIPLDSWDHSQTDPLLTSHLHHTNKDEVPAATDHTNFADPSHHNAEPSLGDTFNFTNSSHHIAQPSLGDTFNFTNSSLHNVGPTFTLDPNSNGSLNAEEILSETPAQLPKEESSETVLFKPTKKKGKKTKGDITGLDDSATTNAVSEHPKSGTSNTLNSATYDIEHAPSDANPPVEGDATAYLMELLGEDGGEDAGDGGGESDTEQQAGKKKGGKAGGGGGGGGGGKGKKKKKK